MIEYSERHIFTRRELDLLKQAQNLVANAPYLDGDGEPIRCHELARAVGRVLCLDYADGRYGFVDHTWLWTESPGDSIPWKLPNVLDVYVPGSLPQVQLVHTDSSGLPPRYYPSKNFDVIVRHEVIESLIAGFA